MVPPQPGATISQDGHTAVLLAGAGADTNEMVRVADDHKAALQALGLDGVTVQPTGASVLWSDFNTANLDAMLTSEMFSWPVTLAILVLAFGALLAAGLPLVLTLAGLVASAGSLVLINHLVPVSIWAMNFAMMFALALGIDYALFIVQRFRAARLGSHEDASQAIAETMDTAGKAVLLSGLTVLVSLSAVMLVPSPSFRSMAGGIMLAVVFVLAATLTLLPVVLSALDERVNWGSLPWVHTGEHRSPRFAAWGERLWRRPVAFGAAAAVRAAGPGRTRGRAAHRDALDQGPPQRLLGARRLRHRPGPVRPGRPRHPAGRRRRRPGRRDHRRPEGRPRASPGSCRPSRPPTTAAWSWSRPYRPSTPPTPPSAPPSTGSAQTCHPPRRSAAQPWRTSTSRPSSTPRPRSWSPSCCCSGFLLLLIALQAPLIAFLGTLVSLLSTAAAFGVARLVFQDGWGAGFMGFESQGFLDAWAPVFFFAMIFAIAMDYTVFLLASAKEHYEKSGDPHEAMVGAVAHSGRVIFAAGAVMVAVFFTFALSGPLPPKEMGIVLGVAVLLDAFLVRLVLLPVLLRLTGRAAWWVPSLAAADPPRHPLLPRLTTTTKTYELHETKRTRPCATQHGAAPAARPPGAAAAAT